MSSTPRPLITDIARQAGVSPATVSRAFNRPELLNAATLAHIRKTAERLGFRRNRLGSSLRSGSTKTLGLVLPTMANPVFAACFEGAESQARAAGYSVMLTTSSYHAERELEAVRELIGHRVEGLLLTVGDPQRSETLDELDAGGMPYVLVYNESDRHPFISVDNAAAAADMMTHLAAQGHRRVAFVSGPLDASDRARSRLSGLRRRMRELDLPAPEHLIMAGHTAIENAQLQRLMTERLRPTALFCSNDLLATAVIASLDVLGYRVPQDISVAGFDGTDFAGLLVPSLATVHQPSADIGREACQQLLCALQGGTPRSQHLPHRLLPGGTVTPLETSLEGAAHDKP